MLSDSGAKGLDGAVFCIIMIGIINIRVSYLTHHFPMEKYNGLRVRECICADFQQRLGYTLDCTQDGCHAYPLAIWHIACAHTHKLHLRNLAHALIKSGVHFYFI